MCTAITRMEIHAAPLSVQVVRVTADQLEEEEISASPPIPMVFPEEEKEEEEMYICPDCYENIDLCDCVFQEEEEEEEEEEDICPIYGSKIRTLMDRANAHLFDLTIEQLAATALRAKFEKYELVGDNGNFDRPMILKLLARKYFFGICTVMFRSLPIDVARYIGKFFDFDVSFQLRAHKYIGEKVEDCTFMIEKYVKRLDRGEHYRYDDYIPIELPCELLHRTVFTHMNRSEILSREYYKMVLQEDAKRVHTLELEYTFEDVEEIRKRDGAQASTDFMVMVGHQLAALKAHYRQMRTDFVEAIMCSDDFAPALLQLEAIPEYIMCRAIAAEIQNPDIRVLPPRW